MKHLSIIIFATMTFFGCKHSSNQAVSEVSETTTLNACIDVTREGPLEIWETQKQVFYKQGDATLQEITSFETIQVSLADMKKANMSISDDANFMKVIDAKVIDHTPSTEINKLKQRYPGKH